MFVPRIGDIKKLNDTNETLLGVQADATVAHASHIMSEHHIGCLVVFDQGHNFVGMISERDMLSKVLAKSLSPDDITVSEVMTSNIISSTRETSINEVERLMAKHRIRHLPVLEQDLPIGMISSRDLIAYRLKSNREMQAAAEQLAMLPGGLKSLDMEDVFSLAIDDVPRSFGAERATVCLAPRDGSEPTIKSNDCECSHDDLIQQAQNGLLNDLIRICTGQKCTGCGNSEKTVTKLVIPLTIHDQCGENPQNQIIPGFLCMCHFADPQEKPDQSQVYKASLLQQMLDTNLTNAKLYQSYQDARKDSETDPLTGVGTRRVLENVLKTECARASRYGKTFSLVIIDLDHFKQINDTAGHAVGDQALQQLAKVIKSCVRETDSVITRYGGDEFVMLIPDAKLPDGQKILERIRGKLPEIELPIDRNVTLSCGLTEWCPDPPDDTKSIMDRADAALYEAKRNGRDRVVAYAPDKVIEECLT